MVMFASNASIEEEETAYSYALGHKWSFWKLRWTTLEE